MSAYDDPVAHIRALEAEVERLRAERVDLARDFRNAGRRWTRAGNQDKATAYRYAAYRLRQPLVLPDEEQSA